MKGLLIAITGIATIANGFAFLVLTTVKLLSHYSGVELPESMAEASRAELFVDTIQWAVMLMLSYRIREDD